MNPMNNEGDETTVYAEIEAGEEMIQFALLFLTVPDLQSVASVNRHFS